MKLMGKELSQNVEKKVNFLTGQIAENSRTAGLTNIQPF
jgi:hypothetical protein